MLITPRNARSDLCSWSAKCFVIGSQRLSLPYSDKGRFHSSPWCVNELPHQYQSPRNVLVYCLVFIFKYRNLIKLYRNKSYLMWLRGPHYFGLHGSLRFRLLRGDCAGLWNGYNIIYFIRVLTSYTQTHKSSTALFLSPLHSPPLTLLFSGSRPLFPSAGTDHFPAE